MACTFEMNDQEEADAKAWIKEHRQTCKPYAGAIGGATSYLFIPTGLGMAVNVQCMCGASKEVTDVSGW